MTVAMSVQPPKAVEAAAAAASAAAVRKRRRRTPAGGAADDCFTCSKRNVKCDRRRPYCSQCLEVGNECSGYKTQLTWGVGVASRGKLRGLSLPIAKAPPVNPGSGSGNLTASGGVSKKTSVPSPSRARTESTSAPAGSSAGSVGSIGSMGSWMDRETLAAAAAISSSMPSTASVSPRRLPQDDGDLVFERSPSLSNASYPSYDYAQMSAARTIPTSGTMPVPMSVPVPISQPNWTASVPVSLSPYPGSLPAEPLSFHPQQHPHSHQQQLHAQQQLSVSLESLSEVDYMSPITQSMSSEDISYISSPAAMIYDNLSGHSSPVPQSPIATMMMEQRPAPTSCPGLMYAPSERDSNLASSHPESLDVHLSAKLLQECDSMGEFLYMYAFFSETGHLGAHEGS